MNFQRTSGPTTRIAVALIALAALTAWAAWRQSRLVVDVENGAMRSVGTDEARALDRRTEGFGAGAVLLCLVEPAAGANRALTDAELETVRGLERGFRALDGVADVERVPNAAPNVAVLAVELVGSTERIASAVEAVRALGRASPSTLAVSLTGQPAGEIAIARAVRSDQARVVPWIAVGLFVLLTWLYRHPGIALAVLVPAGMAIVWTQAAYEVCGRELDPVSVMLPAVLLTVGVAAGVHYVEAFLDRLAVGGARFDAARAAVDDLVEPAMLAALTIVIGFLSLATSPIPAIVDFGVFSALGVALAFAAYALGLPALLAVLGPRRPPHGSERRGTWTGRVGERAAGWFARRARVVRWGTALFALFAFGSWARLTFDNEPLRILSVADPFRVETEHIAAKLGAIEAFDVLVPAGSELADPARLALFAAGVDALPLVAGFAGVPLAAKNGDRLLRFLLAPSGSRDREPLFARVEALARAHGADGVRATGTAVQIARDSGALVRGQVWGSLSGLSVLFLLFWVGLKSARAAVIALVPNVLPCVAVFAGIAWLGRPVSVATAMISSVLLGLIVDDTAHLMHGIRETRVRGASSLEAIEAVFRRNGRAIVVTSIVLTGGFAATALGELETSFEFGAVAAVTIVMALLADLIVLPALLVDVRELEAAEASRG
ncbi:MAG: MMPL family transporter [Planctomycetes bacterium]|nr:MMPL family transporter [Planctomycetota bacterium]